MSIVAVKEIRGVAMGEEEPRIRIPSGTNISEVQKYGISRSADLSTSLPDLLLFGHCLNLFYGFYT